MDPDTGQSCRTGALWLDVLFSVQGRVHVSSYGWLRAVLSRIFWLFWAAYTCGKKVAIGSNMAFPGSMAPSW